MFMSKPDGSFGLTVESIMKCEDFKSNFARKLSNRYISRTPVTPRQELKLQPVDAAQENPEHAPERIEQRSQLSASTAKVQMCKAKSPDKSKDIKCTEEYARNMHVETLKWQLAQTEANRQMHIALLQQIVSFLNRVKDHIECQKTGVDRMEPRILPRSFNSAELPRSRSVLHVSRNQDYLCPPKKISTRKISKSISNVHGFKDCYGMWSQSKVSLTSEIEATQKISEEITRLITLASTVLSTKLPDLAYACHDSINDLSIKLLQDKEELKSKTESSHSLNLIEEDPTNSFILNTICDRNGDYNSITKKYIDIKGRSMNNYILTPSFDCGLENDFADVKINANSVINEVLTIPEVTPIIEKNKVSVDKKNEYNSNFFEDESGFSSMSSFQEIGIPIISIIPPSPNKEIGHLDDIPDLIEETEKWKTEGLLDKQTMKVFWV